MKAQDRVHRSRTSSSDEYAAFDQLNGWHPWMESVPEGFIPYKARQLRSGKVAYFNFELAHEMGLIPANHSHKMTRKLEKRILDTFCLRIINEYDQENKISFAKDQIKPHSFMATRYLQLQHADKTGRTSGDGRCIWNGIVENNGSLWDVSSRGTGVTALAPGVVEAGRPLKSGNTDFGYGCGLAEIDELYAAAIMAEIFHLNGINTERVLAIIDLGKGYGIGVRASQNLIRPAHLFLYLKQGEHDALKRATDYLIERQHKNQEWKFSVRSSRKYDLLLEEVCETFAQFAAQLDRDYIFAWLDWDGDNVLATGGIIDYGSVRQFGLRHDQYRYDDVDRFSTNLNEQRNKARLIIQVFAQMVDFLKTKKKKPLNNFRRHSILKTFDRHFTYYLHDRFLYQLGFSRDQREYLLSKHRPSVKSLFETYSYFERVKTYKKMQKVADGVNRPAIFNMRRVTGNLPKLLLEANQSLSRSKIEAKTFFRMMLADSAGRKDSKLTARLKAKISRLQTQYRALITKAATGNQDPRELLKQMSERAQVINREDRITGNALLNIVGEIIDEKKKGTPDAKIQSAIDNLIQSQRFLPETGSGGPKAKLHGSRRSHQLIQTMLHLVQGYKEDI